jgi:hypothetical protein
MPEGSLIVRAYAICKMKHLAYMLPLAEVYISFFCEFCTLPRKLWLIGTNKSDLHQYIFTAHGNARTNGEAPCGSQHLHISD